MSRPDRLLIRGLTLLVVLGVVSTGLIATGAVPLTGASDRVHDDVVIEPHDGANGAYATVSADGELEVDLDRGPAGAGVVPDGTTTIRDVFVLGYEGTTAAEVWIEDDSADVTFVTDAGPIEGESNAVTLGPDGRVSVGFVVDATGERIVDPGEITIHARLADDAGNATDVERTRNRGDTRVRSYRSGEEVVVAVYGARGGSAVETGIDHPDDADPVRVDRLGLTTRYGGTFDLRVRASESDSFGTPPVGSGTPLGYARIDHTVDDDEISGATVEFSVRTDYLARQGIAPEDVVLYRFHDGSWDRIETTHVGETTTRQLFRAELPGLSVFAVGTGETSADQSGTNAASDTEAERSGNDASSDDSNSIEPGDGGTGASDANTAGESTTPLPETPKPAKPPIEWGGLNPTWLVVASVVGLLALLVAGTRRGRRGKPGGRGSR